jgi:ATP/maltotriose-dependent transcriptional regulator MalT
LATIYADAGDWESVRQIEEEGLQRARRIGSALLEAEAVGMLADLADHDGELEQATELSERYLELSRQVGFNWFVALGNVNNAEFALRLGNYEEARARAREAITLFESMKDRRLVTYAMATLAVIEKRRGELLTAGTLWGSLEALLSRGPIGRTYTDQFADEMATVGDQLYETGRGQGQEMTIEAALEACLGPSWAGPGPWRPAAETKSVGRPRV